MRDDLKGALSSPEFGRARKIPDALKGALHGLRSAAFGVGRWQAVSSERAPPNFACLLAYLWGVIFLGKMHIRILMVLPVLLATGLSMAQAAPSTSLSESPKQIPSFDLTALD